MTRTTLRLESATILEEITVINDDATMNHVRRQVRGDGPLRGAERPLVDDLKEQGLLVKVEPHCP